MLESDLKASVLNTLRSSGAMRAGDIIASEFVLGRKNCRADLAILSDEFIGIEIKSEHDGLKRLESQLDSYLTSFDKVHLVVAEKHLVAATRLVPSSVSLWVESRRTLTQVTSGGPSRLSAAGLADLLTLDELKKLVGPQGRTQRSALMFAAAALPSRDVRGAVLTSFRRGYQNTSASFWEQCKGRKIREEHLALLSPYADARRQHANANAQAKEFWRNWVDVMQANAESLNPSFG